MALNSIYKHNKVVLLRESNYMDYLLIAVRPMPDVFIVKRFNIGLGMGHNDKHITHAKISLRLPTETYGRWELPCSLAA